MDDEHRTLQTLNERINNLERILNSFLVEESDSPITLSANKFVLRDRNGAEKALLSAPDETSTALLLSDSNGTARLFVGLEDRGPTIALYDASETPRLKMAVSDPINGSSISMHDSNRKTRVQISSIEGEPIRIALHDLNGENRVDLFYSEDSEGSGGALALKDSAGGRVMITDSAIAVVDPTGKVLFVTPQIPEANEPLEIPSHLFLFKGGQQHGPYPTQQIKAWLAWADS